MGDGPIWRRQCGQRLHGVDAELLLVLDLLAAVLKLDHRQRSGIRAGELRDPLVQGRLAHVHDPDHIRLC